MPVVTLKMGSSLNPDDIKEADDVYFECHIRSNPKPYKMSWYHNVSFIEIKKERIIIKVNLKLFKEHAIKTSSIKVIGQIHLNCYNQIS